MGSAKPVAAAAPYSQPVVRSRCSSSTFAAATPTAGVAGQHASARLPRRSPAPSPAHAPFGFAAPWASPPTMAAFAMDAAPNLADRAVKLRRHISPARMVSPSPSLPQSVPTTVPRRWSTPGSSTTDWEFESVLATIWRDAAAGQNSSSVSLSVARVPIRGTAGAPPRGLVRAERSTPFLRRDTQSHNGVDAPCVFYPT
nr:unnamed protein product [Digitaria exilis]